MGRNIVLPLKLGAHEEDDGVLRGNPGWCGTSMARGEGATGSGEEMLVKLPMDGRSGSAAPPGVGRKGIRAPGGSDLGLGEAASLLQKGLMKC